MINPCSTPAPACYWPRAGWLVWHPRVASCRSFIAWATAAYLTATRGLELYPCR
jgi:hypothetical protein